MAASRVSTKNGDDGTTRTLAGDILPKNHPILVCTGSLDAVRGAIARLRLLLLADNEVRYAKESEDLLWVLHVLFLIGAEVNDPEAKHPEYRKDEVDARHLSKLEAAEAAIEAQVKLPRAFIVSASSLLAAECDIAATIVRQLERDVVSLKEAVPAFQAAHILRFVNRLSDYLYLLGRHMELGVHHPVDYTLLED
ncbi:MAG: ATP:cob(I)alamin adenosyltransferase [Candidatus Hydrogenedentes bacterium]|nr:ATP:cob(I)alamin adenosyltransferase [Candidatus Hydrogenedentota bacterium]